MPIRKSKDFLPEIHRTKVNKKFLAATLDQLISEPNLKKVSGNVGRKFGSRNIDSDTFIQEPSNQRQNYQLEPALVVKDNDTVTNIVTYPEVVDKLKSLGSNVSREDRLFSQQQYTFNGLVDLDKFINFSQYYWLPNGPDSVNIFSTEVPQTQVFDILRSSDGITINKQDTQNPKLTLMRGGSYTFRVNQADIPFWIQTEPGTSGNRISQENLSTREVKGVFNNGEDVGEITFNVPTESSQDLFMQMSITDYVDLVTGLNFDDVHNRDYDAFITEFGGIDGTKFLDNKKIVFYQNDLNNWYSNSLFEEARYDIDNFAAADPILEEDRYDVWKINIDENNVIKLSRLTEWPTNTKVLVGEGNTYGNRELWKTATGDVALIPIITAPQPKLYYQDGNNENYFGEIDIILENTIPQIDVENDIIGKKTYTSPNGVVFTNGLKIQFDQNTVQDLYKNTEFYVEGVGTSIKLVPVAELITPEKWTVTLGQGYDTTLYDENGLETTFNSPVEKDYIVINRASLDRNAWSRHNRWFHIDVLNKTAEYNNYTPLIDQNSRARRPIIEFEENLQLFNYGRINKKPVDLIDFTVTDTFSEVEGQQGYFVDGVELTNDMRIIFANDNNPDIAGRIFQVRKIDPNLDGVGQIHLTPSDDSLPLINDNIIIRSGLTTQGLSFFYNGTTWVEGQFKSGTNKSPKFDIFDSNNISLNNQLVYQSSSFRGTNIFGYKVGSGSIDNELGIPLSYSTFNNVGDIEFENYTDTDVFTYISNGTSVTEKINRFNLVKYTNRDSSTRAYVWNTNSAKSQQFQIINLQLTTALEGIEIPQINESVTNKTLFVYINNNLTEDYSITTVDGKTYLDFTSIIEPGNSVVIKFSSNIKDRRSYYEVPESLSLNANNDLLSTFTLGQIRNHLDQITKNNPNFSGNFPGSNNLRDLGNYSSSGGTITQHDNSFLACALLLTDNNFNVIDSLEFAQKEYTKFKNKFIDVAKRLDLDFSDIRLAVDNIIKEINSHKSESEFPFYYSDMLGYTGSKNITNYVVTDNSRREWDLTDIYVDNKPSYTGVNVYVNNIQVLKNYDYEIAQGRPAIVFLKDLNIDDQITIIEYTDTRGSFIPATPTKLGLWHKFKPEKYTDTTYINTVDVIKGHDGSITVAYGDIIDDLLLELEKRIYNNIKTEYDYQRFDWNNCIPGAFRSTEYSVNEYNTVLSTQFNKWASRNIVKISERADFDSNNTFTWNYSKFTNKVNDNLLLGGWRGIYTYFYNTETPHLTPWELLGFSEQPAWWVDIYGPAPYTSGNEILWSDLEQGKVYNPLTESYTINYQYARPGLSSIIPVNENGQLLSPLDCLVKEYNSIDANSDYVFGDGGPHESAWKKSSEYPFAQCIVAALLKPGSFLDIQYDTLSTIKVSNQFIDPVTNNRHKFTDHRTHGEKYYVTGLGQYISDYSVYLGVDPYLLEEKLKNTEVNLVYRMAGYSDLNKLKIIATQVTPISSNESIFIPDENTKLILHKSQSVNEFRYSSVIVEKTSSGYEINGYDLDNPYFEIIPSIVTNNKYSITAGPASSTIYKDFNNVIVQIPYGTQFKTKDQVVDFLISHERFLVSQGFIFDEVIPEIGTTRDFVLSAKEFIFWVSQKWSVGSIIVLNPAGKFIKFNRQNEIVDDLVQSATILDNNYYPIRNTKYSVYREDNQFELVTEKTIGIVKFVTVQYEHALVLDNKTIFNDIIYQPELGNRQQAIKINGYITDSWDGTLYAPGFVLNENNITEWVSGKNYAKGDFVKFKGKIYVSQFAQDAAETFDYNKWTLSKNIPTGLLPNWSSKASQFEDFYDLDKANLEQDADTLGKGLIGYQKRNYLENLQLEDVSQVKFYQGMIQEKGTPNSINNLLKTTIDNLTIDLDFYEEWAVRTGSYGAVDINQVLEVKLQEGIVNSNPSIIEFIDQNDIRRPERYQITPENIWKKPSNYTKNIWKYAEQGLVKETDIRTAGYVSLEDVDTTLFSIADIRQLNSKVKTLQPGFTIWVANDVNADWNVYRLTATNEFVSRASVNTNGNIKFKLAENTSLEKDDYILIRNFQSQLDGFYKVVSRVSSTEIIVDAQGQNIEFSGTGIVLKLVPSRLPTASSAIDLKSIINWQDGEYLWIDKDSNNNWQVLEKNSPWDYKFKEVNSVPESDYNLGRSVHVSADNRFLVSGQPGDNSVVTFLQTATGYAQSGVIAPFITDLQGFGFSVTGGDTGYYAVGAPESNNSKGYVIIVYRDSGGNFTPLQILLDPDEHNASEFGYSVDMSHNGDWLYVGAPGKNTVYAFARVLPDLDDSTSQVSTITGNGIDNTFELDRTFSTVWSFSVIDEDGKIYRPYLDYELTDTNTIEFTFVPPALFTYVVREQEHFAYVDEIVATDIDTKDRFGHSLHTTTNGNMLLIGSPIATVIDKNGEAKTEAGAAYVYERSIERFVASGASTSFNTVQNINPNVNSVFVNEIRTTDVTTTSSGVEFSSAPANGVVIDVETNQFNQIQKVVRENPNHFDHFGWSSAICFNDCSIYIGSPGADSFDLNSGSVLRFVNTAKTYKTISGNVDSSLISTGDILKVNNRTVVLKGTTAEQITTDILNENIQGVSAEHDGNTITLSSTSSLSLSEVTPGLLDALGITVLRLVQTISHPNSESNERFGYSMDISRSSNVLVVGSPYATTYKFSTYDNTTTTYDSASTRFVDPELNSGSVYVFELLLGATTSIDDAGAFIPIQQLVAEDITPNDEFGFSVSVSDKSILVGSPLDETTQSNQGSIYIFSNNNQEKGWKTHNTESKKIDIDSINSVKLYNTNTNKIVESLDFIDPAKGKIAGPAKQNIDIISDYDPAIYNTGNAGNNNDTIAWGEQRNGIVWWDTSTLRYLDYEQGTIDQRVKYWGQMFPGSSVDVYEYVSSLLTPLEYIEENSDQQLKYISGENFTVQSEYDQVSNTFKTTYYFWVKNKKSLANKNKSLSVNEISNYIKNPSSIGFPYIIFVNSSTVAAYNVNDLLENNNVALSINFDIANNDKLLHTEYQLLKQGDANSLINDRLFRKIKDSLAGTTLAGDQVPDKSLIETEKLGIEFRPRQTMIDDRSTALDQLVNYLNQELAKDSYATFISFNNLNSQERTPSIASKLWDRKVDTDLDLQFINANEVGIGFRVLVSNDTTEDGLWTIRTLSSDNKWIISRVQSYKTSRYWSFVDWYKTGYDSNTIINYTVASVNEIVGLNLQNDDIIRVSNNVNGKFEIYRFIDSDVELVGLQDGTIRLSNSLFDITVDNIGFDNEVFDLNRYDENPSIEIHKILDAIKDDIFIGNKAKLFNDFIFNIFDIILREQNYVDWLFKTSFISLEHKIRGLDQYSTYQPDNQTFLIDYINEAKPYHTKIREYLLRYDKTDNYSGDVTDFDINSFYDTALGLYRKPESDNSEDASLFQQGENRSWNENHTYVVNSIEIVSGGSGYSVAPKVTISAPSLGGVTATANCVVRNGVVHKINITNPGSGYITTPSVILEGGNGTGARLSVRIENYTTRKLDTTIKLDRYRYTSDVLDWEKNTSYSAGAIISYSGKAYKALQSFTSADLFDNTNLEVLGDDFFDNANDRIMSFYAPTKGMAGKDLSQLMSGIEYPGVKVKGPGFDLEPGYDVTAYDIEPFDNFEISAEGLTVLSENVVDTKIQSQFTDSSLGLRPADININGSKFIDEYSSHAPEEHVPGRVYDTLDMQVYQSPTSNFIGQGNGIPINVTYVKGTGTQNEFDIITGDRVIVYTKQRGPQYLNVDYTVDYNDQTINFVNPLSSRDIGYIYGFEVSGENTLLETSFEGDGSTVSFEIELDPISAKQTLVLVNGSVVEHVVTKKISSIEITLLQVPVENENIKIWVFNQSGDIPYSLTSEQLITVNSNEYSYELEPQILYSGPKSSNVIVELNGSRLRPSNSVYYKSDGSTLTYDLPSSANEFAFGIGVNPGDVEVFVNDKKLIEFVDYLLSFDDGSSVRQVNLLQQPAIESTIIVSLSRDAEYRIQDGLVTLNTDLTINQNDILRVISFTNHNNNDIHTKVFTGSNEQTLEFDVGFSGTKFDISGFDDVTSLSVLSKPIYVLDRNIENSTYLWVTVDGIKLHPGIDYIVSSNSVQIATSYDVQVDSVVVITSFTEVTSKNAIAWRYFSNMLGETEVSRMVVDHTTTLAEELTLTSTEIVVEDGEKLEQPSPANNRPGVIFINGERITYWQKEQDTLSQLRRGTGGTSVPESHNIGSRITNASYRQVLHKQEELLDTITYSGDGSSTIFGPIPYNQDTYKIAISVISSIEYNSASNYSISGNIIKFVEAPPEDSIISVEIYTDKTWYDVGSSSPSNGDTLQRANTKQALFLTELQGISPLVGIFVTGSYVVSGYVEEGYIQILE